MCPDLPPQPLDRTRAGAEPGDRSGAGFHSRASYLSDPESCFGGEVDGSSIPPEALPLGRDPNTGVRITMLYGIYDLLWSVALLLTSPWWVFRSLFHSPTWSMVRGRLTLNLKPLAPPCTGVQRILIHGVSVGEVKAAQSLVAALKEQCEVVISASTNTGMQVARQLYPDLDVVRFPIDHMWPVTRFMRRVQPSVVVLMELEVWPNFLRKSNRLGVPVAIASGRITEASHASYRRFGTTLPQFNRISVFAVQNEQHAARFADLAGSRERVVVTGNVKIDGLAVGAVPDGEALQKLRALVAGGSGRPVLVAGSTHAPEERMAFGAFRRAAPHARIVIVPRHPNRAASVVEDLAVHGAAPQRLTALRSGEQTLDLDQPLIVDTIGELECIYSLADLVFVGGSLVPHGGQNVLEPAARGKAVLHGPHVDNFLQETVLLEQAGGSWVVASEAELERATESLVGDQERRERMGAAGMDAVEAQKGATLRTLRILRRRLALKG